MSDHEQDHFFSLTPDSLREWCDARSMPKFRADQILDWVYGKCVAEPSAMSNLSSRDRDTLAAEMTFLSGDTVAHQFASDGVQKLLIQWRQDDKKDAQADLPSSESSSEGISLPVHPQAASDPTRQTECVMIPTERRKTACVSSQIGCPVGCHFCASGLGGLDGNLTTGQIVEQVWRLSQLEHVGRISNVVFMGMGEPLANFDAVRRSIETICAPWGMNISARKVTLSTVGLPKYIDRLAEELNLPVTLALSLHAPNDELRRRLIPWSEFTTIESLLESCQRWFEKTGREITLEYTLMGGVNDRPEHARQLATIARTLRSNVNLIRYNEVDGLEFKRPLSSDVHAFQKILLDADITAHLRASRGRDIAAACGQLRHETISTQ